MQNLVNIAYPYYDYMWLVLQDWQKLIDDKYNMSNIGMNP